MNNLKHLKVGDSLWQVAMHHWADRALSAREHKIVAESKVSWIIGDYQHERKIPKSKPLPHGFFFTEAEAKEAVWGNQKSSSHHPRPRVRRA